mmetsp:Transcript_10809/g.28733  ORF Transcript_10809/g.28733 Transcript_10809/m.28733 type:complete len:237 (+) Transcript_10809:199-909(+)
MAVGWSCMEKPATDACSKNSAESPADPHVGEPPGQKISRGIHVLMMTLYGRGLPSVSDEDAEGDLSMVEAREGVLSTVDAAEGDLSTVDAEECLGPRAILKSSFALLSPDWRDLSCSQYLICSRCSAMSIASGVCPMASPSPPCLRNAPTLWAARRASFRECCGRGSSPGSGLNQGWPRAVAALGLSLGSRSIRPLMRSSTCQDSSAPGTTHWKLGFGAPEAIAAFMSFTHGLSGT